MFNFRKIKSFTLIESLVSLLLLGLVCLLFQTGVQQLRHLQNYSLTNQKEDFNVFLLQLQHETKDFIYRKTENHQIDFQEKTLGSVYIQFKGGLIRIQNKLGHHPLLMDVRACQFKEIETGVTIEVTFTDGQKEAGFLTWPKPD